MIKNVLLITPPDNNEPNFNYETCKLGRYPNFPPYGLGILATHLRNDGVDVDILNLNNAVLKDCRKSDSESNFDFAETIRAYLIDSMIISAPDLIGVTCMFSQTHQSTVD